MRRLLVAGTVVLLSGCAGTTLSDDAKKACGEQTTFNAIASAASIFGPSVAAGASAASAIVGAGCAWVK